jgi:hypothetical protein
MRKKCVRGGGSWDRLMFRDFIPQRESWHCGGINSETSLCCPQLQFGFRQIGIILSKYSSNFADPSSNCLLWSLTSCDHAAILEERGHLCLDWQGCSQLCFPCWLWGIIPELFPFPILSSWLLLQGHSLLLEYEIRACLTNCRVYTLRHSVHTSWCRSCLI